MSATRPMNEEQSILDKTVVLHERALLYEVLLTLHPTTAILSIAGTALYEIWKRRAQLFANRLIELNIYPAAERLRDAEFLQALAAAMRRVRDAASDKKVTSFADMFATYCKGEHFQSVDHFDEYLSILHELSEREFQVLVILHKYEQANPLEGRNPLQRAVAVWDSFQQEVEREVGINPPQLPAVLTRIQRTGLYETITGNYWDYTGGKGALTPLFLDFISTLNISKK
jgi:hypothetical protein